MKNKMYIFFAIFFVICGAINPISATSVCADMRVCYMAIVIDDFGGYNRNGVKEMLSLDIPLTCAVMPGCDNTFCDAESANKAGHEVILHMPMEAHTYLPEEWYGSVCVKNSDEPGIAREKVEKSFNLIPYAKGMNIHIGSGVSKNSAIMTEILSLVKDKKLYFCDSKTVSDSVCESCAMSCGTDFISRDEFLETTHYADYNHTKQMLIKGAKDAMVKGYSVVIGHVGAEGGISTYEAIRDTIFEIQNMGVEIVPLSKVISVKYGRSR